MQLRSGTTYTLRVPLAPKGKRVEKGFKKTKATKNKNRGSIRLTQVEDTFNKPEKRGDFPYHQPIDHVSHLPNPETLTSANVKFCDLCRLQPIDLEPNNGKYDRDIKHLSHVEKRTLHNEIWTEVSKGLWEGAASDPYWAIPHIDNFGNDLTPKQKRYWINRLDKLGDLQRYL